MQQKQESSECRFPILTTEAEDSAAGADRIIVDPANFFLLPVCQLHWPTSQLPFRDIERAFDPSNYIFTGEFLIT
jgi:hypothetical protein